MLNRHGLEGATVSRIAKQAKVSPGNVYRRFPDKEALMRAVFSRGTEVNREELALKVEGEQLTKIGIRNFTPQWIAGMLGAYRASTGSMRATVLYAQQHERTPFVRRQRDLEVRSLNLYFVIGNVFKPFLILLCPDSSSAQFPKRLAHGELARYKALSLNRELVCPNKSRKSADPQHRTRIREHPPSNQSLTSACQGFCRNLSR